MTQGGPPDERPDSAGVERRAAARAARPAAARARHRSEGLALGGSALWLPLLGALCGAVFESLAASAVLALLGLGVAAWRAVGAHVERLAAEQRRLIAQVAALERSLAAPAAIASPAARPAGPETAIPASPGGAPARAGAEPMRDTSPVRPRMPPGRERRARLEMGGSAVVAPHAAPERVASAASEAVRVLAGRMLAAVRGFLLGGNAMVRAGILVLLVGVVLLARYAAEQALLPIEARLALAALLGAALLGAGLRLRGLRPELGATLQGGGIGALYITVFFAYQVFDLIPAGAAFALFIALAGAAAALAVVQHAQSLVVIGCLAGFAAPVAASSGAGSHVALFSYYLVLDGTVAAVAWLRGWRAIPLLAFVATYGVATVWGVLRYVPADFATTEPFVLAFWALFTGTAVAFALQRPPRLAGAIDGTLLFGTPLVTLLAQSALLRGSELGMACTSVGLASAYSGLAVWLLRAAPAPLRQMGEACGALAVGLATLAVPLALDDGLTVSLVWSLEGAGVYWVGARQGRALARMSGIALQPLAAAGWLFEMEATGRTLTAADSVPLASGVFLGALGLALTGGAIACLAYRFRDVLRTREVRVTQALCGWALLWWIVAVTSEIVVHVASDVQAAALVLACAASAVAVDRIGARLDFLPGRLIALAALPLAWPLVALYAFAAPTLVAGGGWLAWPALVAALYVTMARLESAPVPWLPKLYAPVLWTSAMIAGAVGASLCARAAAQGSLGGDWAPLALGLAAAGALAAAAELPSRGVGPFGRHRDVHLALAAPALAAVCALFAWLGLSEIAGRFEPLPYVPLLNPGDLTALFAGFAALQWTRALGEVGLAAAWRPTEVVPRAVFVLGFMWGSASLARAVHHMAGVPYRFARLWDSAALQASLSITWTLVGLAGLVIATRRSHRTLWMVHAGLLGVVVAKLFLVDLRRLDAPAKIVTFLVVGALLLLVGYLSPVPPAAASRGPDAGGDDPPVPVPAGTTGAP
jgi:uncharacterized membrane protein